MHHLFFLLSLLPRRQECHVRSLKRASTTLPHTAIRLRSSSWSIFIFFFLLTTPLLIFLFMSTIFFCFFEMCMESLVSFHQYIGFEFSIEIHWNLPFLTDDRDVEGKRYKKQALAGPLAANTEKAKCRVAYVMLSRKLCANVITKTKQCSRVTARRKIVDKTSFANWLRRQDSILVYVVRNITPSLLAPIVIPSF